MTHTSTKVSKNVKNKENEIKPKNTKQLTKLTIQPRMESIKEDDVDNTKATSSSESVTYVNPFVTVSRGKSSARKEFKRRIVHGGNSSINCQIEIKTYIKLIIIQFRIRTKQY